MMARGATLHLSAPTVLMFPATLVEYLRDQEITMLFFVPSLLSNLASLDMLAQYSLPQLNKILFAGEVMPLPTLKYLRKHFPDALLSNLYGPTEITVDAMGPGCGDAASLEQLESVPLGRPCENSEILFLDEENRVVTAADVQAEICVGGVGVGLGYWNNPRRPGKCSSSIRAAVPGYRLQDGRPRIRVVAGWVDLLQREEGSSDQASGLPDRVG